MATKKNPLAQNIPTKSTLKDIDRIKSALGIDVELEDSYIKNPVHRWDFDKLGDVKVRACGYKENDDGSIDIQFRRMVFDNEKAKWIGTEEKTTYRIKPGKENAFKYAVNTRSDFHLQNALGDIPVSALTVHAIAKYAAKYPIDARYDYTEWVDPDTNELKQSTRPKLQLWFKEDFDKEKPTFLSLDDIQ